jgi:hypothetical protein
MSDDSEREREDYEGPLQRRLKLLKEQFEAGKVHIADGLNVVDSLRAVRYAPDGTVTGLWISRQLTGPSGPWRCAWSGLSQVLDLIGAPGEIRTPDLLVRSQALYPTELRAHRLK